MHRATIAFALAVAACAALPPARADAQATADVAGREANAQEAELFERSVRPVLVEHCHSCHGPAKQQGGLRLDSATGLLKGSDNGEVVVAGDPEQSLLVEVIGYEGSTKMPPKRKLPQPAIDALTAWVKAGAPWPKTAGNGPMSESQAAVGRNHWAFQPVKPPSPPSVVDANWCSSPIDAFILARLEAVRLRPSPPADRRTLIRRATFDLHGLPPTPEEVAAFEADTSPAAFARVVDRLLSSPRYGERWGRHWLDVARYADTKGYVRLNENPNYTASWTYRDYVIRAFNEDLPYDRFVVEQLAADQLVELERGDDPRPLAALGFLTLGQRFINSQHDIIDDRIDVTTRGLMGLTASCARCHDHKFDPIPTRDYYSLHGVFASSIEPHVPPLIVTAAERTRYASYLRELDKRTAAFEQFLRHRQAELTASFRARAGEYLLAAQREQVQANFLATMFLVDTAKELNPVVIQRWGQLLEATREKHHPVLALWHALAQLRPEEFAERAQRIVEEMAAKSAAAERAAGEKFNPLVVAALARSPLSSLSDAAARYGELFEQADRRWRQFQVQVQGDGLGSPSYTRLEDPAWEELRQLLYGAEAPSAVSLAEVEEFLFVDTTTQQEFHKQQRNVEDWIASPGAASHAQVLADAAVPYSARVFVRGNASNPGEVVPRQFLEVLTRGERRPFVHGSGRLELARAIADPANPLTARVLVNRVWLHHFGAGLVRTPGDFGLRGEPPTHPELLDYLAWRFVEEGWSIKGLHRLMMLSAVYQQSSQASDSPEEQNHQIAQEKDPENRLWGKMNRRRLDWESLRDSLLAVAGRLDDAIGGPAVDLLAQPYSGRRTVYGFIDRQNVPGVMRTFDFVPPDATNSQRHQTTVAPQSLFLMNSAFLREQVGRLTARPEIASHEQIAARVDALHRLLYGRRAQPDEIELAARFVLNAEAKRMQSSGHLTPWEEYVQVLLLANEFAFVD